MVIFIDKMAAASSSLKFVDSHNIIGYLLDPPTAHKEFQSMIAGLNSCRISQALRANPVIRKDMITDFWNNASVNKQAANGAGAVESMVKGTKVIIFEQTIREVLEFDDAPEFPIEYSADRVREVLEKMCYEGSYPSTMKKLLPPYWRFLAHTFVSCISGTKGGSDEISQTATSAIVALVMDWDYNFSRFVFEEMKSNLLGKKKDLFLMYPRFLQMIFDEKYPQIERTSDTLDVKALGPNTFGLIKQSRKSAKVVYQGSKELVKFGKFSEKEEVQDAPVAINEPAESDLGLLPRKRKRTDPRPGVLITDQVQETSTPIEPSIVAQDVQSPITESTPMDQDDQSPILEESQIVEEEVVPTEVVQVDISKGKSKLPESEFVDVVMLQNRVFDLEQDAAEKDLTIGKLDIRISELEKDNSEKNSKISELQANLGGLTALYFDLTQRLFQKFGDEFQSLGDEGEKATTAEERREKQRKIDQQRLKRADLLIMKNSDQNVVSSNRPEMYVQDVGKRFSDKYGDRSGIRVWGFDDDRKMWFVKRKSGNVEYYKKKVHFMSRTKIDISELLQAPFHNPSNEPKVSAFKSFLEDQTH